MSTLETVKARILGFGREAMRNPLGTIRAHWPLFVGGSAGVTAAYMEAIRPALLAITQGVIL
jgi:hypothetical protein